MGSINIIYKNGLTKEMLKSEVGKVKDPKLVVWYVGDGGFKKDGVSFYRKLFRTVSSHSSFVKNESKLDYYLYDMTSWNLLKGNSSDIQNKNFSIFNDKDKRLHGIRSYDFFQWVNDLYNTEYGGYIRNNILKYDFIYKSSLEFKECGILWKDAVQKSHNKYRILEDIEMMDCTKIYSILQYLECLYLVWRLVQENNKEKEINILFCLPNDESKYYRDDKNMLKEDLIKLLGNNVNINIVFLCFKFGNNSKARPYNAGNILVEDLLVSDIL
ncbi:Hypothetical protein ORPV_795 [Orpheovirus IHUMI-LCC2]|uniref:Uncharacterized protein n=1 Tax=Orpheovirus IHUMI-LCC2 TaxID=2023057 RepID=A0A2I2L5G5_9VIRU|nr:Hypothetical protein ORPV_795 [Orpheovirus IHUMI-LCC2]SNW62699.1 Hypothetical protein ORPV_795 [Orpheovirus IHUMI-LCC2]